MITKAAAVTGLMMDSWGEGGVRRPAEFPGGHSGLRVPKHHLGHFHAFQH